MIFYTKPSITSLESKYVNDAIDNGWVKIVMSILKNLKRFSNFTGVNMQ